MQNSQLTKPEAPFLTARDAPTVEATNHESNHSYTAATSEALLFTGVNSCVLSPEVTEGPYCKFRVLSRLKAWVLRILQMLVANMFDLMSEMDRRVLSLSLTLKSSTWQPANPSTTLS